MDKFINENNSVKVVDEDFENKDIFEDLKSKEEDRGSVLVKKIYDKELGKEKIDRISLKDRKYKNKDIIQSYIITTAGYSFSSYEKHILLRIIDCFQYLLEGEKLDKNFSVKENLHGDITITLPLSSLLLNRKDTNHAQVKNALYSLLGKRIKFESDKEWEASTLIVAPKIIKYNRTVTFNLHPIIYEALLDFSKGYRKYELETAISFKSVYAIRFYEFFSGQTASLTYSIEILKSMFGLQNKYKDVYLFVNRVIKPAKKELDLKAPFSFTYQLEYEKKRTNPHGGRKKVIGITFNPIYHPKNRDSTLAIKDKSRNFELLDLLYPDEIKIFMSLGFSEHELKVKYKDLLQDINLARKHGVIIITFSIIEYAQKAKNLKIYVIRTLRKKIKIWKESLLDKNHDSMITLGYERECINKDERASVYSFLKNHLGLNGEYLSDCMEYVMERGSKGYLNRLVSTYIDKEGKIDEKKVLMYIKNEFSKSRFLSKIVSKKQLNLKFSTDRKAVENNDSIDDIKIISDMDRKNNIDSNFVRKQMKNGWRKIVVSKLNFREKILYYIKFGSTIYLKKKAKELGLKILM